MDIDASLSSNGRTEGRKHERENQREIEIRSDWAGCLEPCEKSLQAQQIGDHEVWLIPDLFSQVECEALLAQAEEHGFGTTNYPKSYRGNLRLITMDNGLAEAVWRRLDQIIPRTIMLHGEEWEPYGLNACWRLAKYYPGDRFGAHCDSCFCCPEGRSMFTVNIYMSGGFDGGATRFYFESHDEFDYSVIPEVGSCLLFRQTPGQNYRHDGEELRSGVKYLFRSDVMCRRKTPAEA